MKTKINRTRAPHTKAAKMATAISACVLLATSQAQSQSQIDVWDSSDPNNYILVGTIETILSAETGKEHYDYYNASGHPECVNLARSHANTWIHQNSTTDEFTFGFIFAKEVTVADEGNLAKLNFRIVDSLGNPYVSQSDDPNEAVETPSGSNAFVGNFRYNSIYTDGIAVSGVTGGAWTVIIDSVDFGKIKEWYASGGGVAGSADCDDYSDDINLSLGTEYRLTPSGNPPSGAPVNPLANADAGEDYSMDEGQLVTLDGHLSSADAELTYAWTQVSGTPVAITNADQQYASFTAPEVELGGETLTFQLTVDADGTSDSDTVNITIVNINHIPVADAGDDLSIAEGSPVLIDGSDSYDVDNDPLSYSWVQVGGPSVSLTGFDTAELQFTAPLVEAGGAAGVVATLIFELTVDDGFAPDAPVAGYSTDSAVDRVTVEITNLNNLPVADAGPDQTLNEHSLVQLDGTNSSDPDSDPLTYAWSQTGGVSVALSDPTSASPTFTAPFVNSGGSDLVFQLTVADDYNGQAIDTVVIHLQNSNDPPLVSAAEPTVACIWPPNHGLVEIGIKGVSDPDDNAVITIDAVTQDESTNGLGDGDTPVDAIINADGTVMLRAERSGKGNGRVYQVHFTASDLEGSASGVVSVCVPHNKKRAAIDDGGGFDSTE